MPIVLFPFSRTSQTSTWCASSHCCCGATGTVTVTVTVTAAVPFVQALVTLASLLGVEEAVLEKMLTQRVVQTRGEVFVKQLEENDANLTRDAIVKSLYEVG